MNNENNNNNNIESKKSLYNIAFIFGIISTVLLGWMIIPLAWCIPMTLAIKRAKEEVGTPQEKPHTLLGVASLFFLSFISAILILVADSSK